jgi:hypothetical protein
MEVSGQLNTLANLSPGKAPPYPLDRRLGGSQSQSGPYGKENHFAPSGNSTPTVQPVAHHYIN